MRKLQVILSALLIMAPTVVRAQQFELPDNIDEFGIRVKENLLKASSADALDIGESFEKLWAGFGPDQKIKIIDHAKAMVEHNYKIKPYFLKYFKIIVLAINNEQLDGQQFIELLNVNEKVIKLHSAAELITYFDAVINFFENHSLYFSSSNRLIAANYSYTFEYPNPFVTNDFLVDYTDAEEIQDEFYEDQYEDEAEYEDEDNYTYDDEYDTYEEDDYSEDEYKVDEEEYFPDPPPPLEGPVITFYQTDLKIISFKKEAEIKTTSGSFIILKGLFSGSKGTINWSSGGLGDRAIVTLAEYNFDVSRPDFSAKTVKLEYPGKIEAPIEGELSYEGRKGRSGIRFVSYKDNIRIRATEGPGTSLKGGFNLVGDKINTASQMFGISVLSVEDQGVLRFKATSRFFTIQDSLIESSSSAVTIYHKMDSIFHPSAIIRYNPYTQELIVRSADGSYKYTPFYSSFANMDITADIIKWNLNSDSLEISIISGRSEVPVIFQSEEYYNSEILHALSKNYRFNPLLIAVDFVRKHKGQEVLPDEIAKQYDLDPKMVENAMKELAQWGYINYDRNTYTFTLKKKTRHIYMAKRGKVDYDNLLILSNVSSGPNVIFDLEADEIYINGIEKFYISQELDVYIIPDSNRITMGENRSFKFNGRLFAGNFEYVGKDFNFRYDSFLIDLNNIEKIQFYIQDENSRSSKKTKIDNVIAGITEEDSLDNAGLGEFQGTSGTLYVNKPDNKAGRKVYPEYPRFSGGGMGSIVYFSGKEYMDGVYGKSLYFVLPPFDLDSLSDSDPAAINFAGTFHSRGMMPEFKEKLHIMADNSLGFDHSVTQEGYPLFNGDARIFNRIILDKRGLRSEGKMEYLTTTIQSEDFIYYPDSITTKGLTFDMKEEEFNGLIYPKIYVENFDMKWLPSVDSMHIRNNDSHIKLYDGLASLDGLVSLTHKGVFGKGKLISTGSETVSRAYNFQNDQIRARHADFVIKSSDPEKPALAGNDIRLNFDLLKNTATINPEIEGEAALEFPYAQFKTSIPTAVWDLAESKVTMNKPENVDIQYSYFYSTREDLDSLSFNATQAVYDINTLELTVSGIPYITVADSRITPENGEVLILENSRIGTLTNTTLEIDTLNAYHQLYNGTIDIISRNEFSGSATYRFINAVQDTFAIKLENFRLEPITDKKGRIRNELQTVANGLVSEEEALLISPGMLYRGNIIMEARKPALRLDGFVKLDLKKISDYNTWIQYASDAEQQEVILDFDNSLTEFSQKLTAGLHFDYRDYSLYSTFINDKREVGDEDFFIPNGLLSFKPDSSEYVIAEQDKDLGLSYAGKIMVYNEETFDLHIEGPVNFIENNKDRNIYATVIGDGNLETSEFSFDVFLTMDFQVPTGIYEIMSDGFLQAIDMLGPPEAIKDRTTLLYKLADLIGDKAAKEYEKRSSEVYTPLASMSPKLVKPFTFSELSIKWSDDQKAFYNDKGVLGISNVLRNDINASFESFFEIRKGVDGDRIDLFIKAAPEYWYYFSYEDNKLLIYSSVKELNDLVKQKTNQGKTKINEFVFAPGDRGETQRFVNEFRLIYYGIKEPYDLGGEIQEDEEKKKDVSDDEDEGF